MASSDDVNEGIQPLSEGEDAEVKESSIHLRRMSEKDWFFVAEEKELTIQGLLDELTKLNLENEQLKTKVARLEGRAEGQEGEIVGPSPPADSSKGQGSPRHDKLVESLDDSAGLNDVQEALIDDTSASEADTTNTKKESRKKVPIDRADSQLLHKLPDKVINMAGDEDLEKKNREHMEETHKETLSNKVAQMTGEATVLKKKLRDRFGSQIHKENAEMQAACEKYNRIKKESVMGYLHGTAGEMKIALKTKLKQEKKQIKNKVDEYRSSARSKRSNGE
ncbi:hypothetical protein TrRE_jg10044 [Triparma retinervis]|jgi:hypothetical protein|uniref:Uncharacterized protein n=1 Tax=Triparma retinervis TaxID=2557542 RepID=A0A9W6ZKS6_9STRA|nr:hypothetical protein TrRE_jg10044 [Triparma retinervis]